MLVVDFAQVIDIDQANGQRTTIAGMATQFRQDNVVNSSAVEQASQRIGQRQGLQIAQAPLQLMVGFRRGLWFAPERAPPGPG